MKYLRVGAASINQTPLDWEGNVARILAVLEEAEEEGVDILCLPELCITGYGCEDSFLSPHVHAKAQEALDLLRRQSTFTGIYTVGLPLVKDGNIYNCMAVIHNNNTKGFYAKQNLAKDGLHYEPRWFRPWPKQKAERVVVNEPLNEAKSAQPFLTGNLLFETGHEPTDRKIRFGFEICEDAWVHDRPAATLAKHGVDVIFCPSASHFEFGKHEVRRNIVTSGSRAYNCCYVYANLLGNESGRVVYDGSTLISEGGRIVEEGPRFSFQDHQLITADIIPERTPWKEFNRRSFERTYLHTEGTPHRMFVGYLPNNRPEYVEPEDPSPVPKFWRKDKEFEGALTLGLFDYLRKSQTQGYVISLSGGADSGAAAMLVMHMYKRALEELGEDGFKERLAHIENDITPENLLTTVYQATRNSSETTREAAESIARTVKSKHLEVDVDAIVEQYKGIVGDALGLEWDWDEHDVPLQNIQARARSPLAWMIANTEDKILLATSNRSEAAVGYCTQGGDDAGGLAPLSGIDKHFLLEWLEYMAGYISSIQLVLDQKPTAELRPQEEAQTDEKDLMPYEVLDRIEHLAVHDKKGPTEVWELLQHEFSADAQRSFEWVEKFYILWSRNQWKRHRTAPSFHLCNRNLDPSSWCRFPILSGGFRYELEQLREKVASQ